MMVRGTWLIAYDGGMTNKEEEKVFCRGTLLFPSLCWIVFVLLCSIGRRLASEVLFELWLALVKLVSESVESGIEFVYGVLLISAFSGIVLLLLFSSGSGTTWTVDVGEGFCPWDIVSEETLSFSIVLLELGLRSSCFCCNLLLFLLLS
jgi:hypothetical protein